MSVLSVCVHQSGPTTPHNDRRHHILTYTTTSVNLQMMNILEAVIHYSYLSKEVVSVLLLLPIFFYTSICASTYAKNVCTFVASDLLEAADHILPGLFHLLAVAAALCHRLRLFWQP